MSRTLIAAAVCVAAATFTTAAVAADGETPFPSPKVLQVFVAAQTVTPERAVITQVAPGGTVVFRAYAVDGDVDRSDRLRGRHRQLQGPDQDRGQAVRPVRAVAGRDRAADRHEDAHDEPDVSRGCRSGRRRSEARRRALR